MNPLVSAIIPAYNRGRALLDTVETVFEQTWRPLELVIVDDGSTDDTPEVMQEIAELAEKHGIEYTGIRQANGGAGAARNAGMKAAKGEFLSFLDADDRWYPEKTAKQVAEMQRTNADLCCCYVVRYSVKGKTSRIPSKLLLGEGEPRDALIGKASAHMNSLMLSRRAAENHDGFEVRLRNYQDHELMIRLAFKVPVCFVREILATYDCRGDSLTRVPTWEMQVRKNGYLELLVRLLKERLADHPDWDEASWSWRASRAMARIIKQYLWRCDFPGAKEKIATMHELVGNHPLYRQMKRRYLKYRVLSAIGYPVKKDRWS